MIFTKKHGRSSSNSFVAGKYTRARASLARMYTNGMFESKDGTTSMKIVN